MKKPKPKSPGPDRIPGHRTKGLKNVVPFGADIDRAVRRGDRPQVLSLMQKSRVKLIQDMDALNELHSSETSDKRRKELMRQIKTTNNRLVELGYHLE
jgi:hypothetical protein